MAGGLMNGTRLFVADEDTAAEISIAEGSQFLSDVDLDVVSFCRNLMHTA